MDAVIVMIVMNANIVDYAKIAINVVTHLI